VQALLSVVHPVGLIAAQVPLAQLPPQQSVPCAHALPSCAHAPAQLPLTQLNPQHWTGDVQAVPMGEQPPGPVVARTQVWVVASQLPTQQSALVVHICASGAHELLGPASSLPRSLLPVDE
jgi:hypothetical protein